MYLIRPTEKSFLTLKNVTEHLNLQQRNMKLNKAHKECIWEVCLHVSIPVIYDQRGQAALHHNIITSNSWHSQGPLPENKFGYKYFQCQHYNADVRNLGKTVEVTSTEEANQHTEKDFCVSHTAFSFHQLKLPEEKSNYTFLIYIRNISEY